MARLYYQSTSKEFVEFLRDENRTNGKGQEMYNVWATNGMCPPTLVAELVWQPIFELQHVGFTAQQTFRADFRARPGVTYTIEYSDHLGAGAVWQEFANQGSLTATSTTAAFEDDFTANTSGGAAPTGMRFYRFKYNGTP